jgi:hypothetical protein
MNIILFVISDETFILDPDAGFYDTNKKMRIRVESASASECPVS